MFTGPGWSHVPVGQVLSVYQNKGKMAINHESLVISVYILCTCKSR